jgi:hypothetical protein
MDKAVSNFTRLRIASDPILDTLSDSESFKIKDLPKNSVASDLFRVQPEIWRRVEVPGHINLRGLHDIIQYLFGWIDTHLHEFKIDSTTYGLPDPENDQSDVVETTVSVD